MTAKRAMQKQKRWWETTTAFISAVSGLIIAITGLIVLFYKPTPSTPPQPPYVPGG